jgi:mRNA-degrading endonuclease RelE of RelBE toxin-antitoxin system
MNVSVRVSAEFERQAKRLAKKYKSFVNDFALFVSDIKKIHIQALI